MMEKMEELRDLLSEEIDGRAEDGEIYAREVVGLQYQIADLKRVERDSAEQLCKLKMAFEELRIETRTLKAALAEYRERSVAKSV